MVMIIELPEDSTLVRVLDISQLLKEHITDMILEASEKAARKGFNENVFDIFGYVDHRDLAYLRLEARPIHQQAAMHDKSILAGSYTTTYKEMTPDFLRVWDAGHVCLAPKGEMELLIAAPTIAPQLPRYLDALDGWIKSVPVKQGEVMAARRIQHPTEHVGPTTVDNVVDRVEDKLNDIADTCAMFPTETKAADPRAWRQMLIYVPREHVEAHLKWLDELAARDR